MKRAFNHAARETTPRKPAQTAELRKLKRRLNRVLMEIATVPEGRELISIAAERKVSINFVKNFRRANTAALYIHDPETGEGEIRLNAKNEERDLLSDLVHELRHMQQAHRLGQFPTEITWPNMRETMLMNRVMEADAQVFSYMVCLKLKQDGKPQYLDAFEANYPALQGFSVKNKSMGKKEMALALFNFFQQHETHTYDDELRENTEKDMKKTPDEFAYKKGDLSQIFNFKTAMKDLRRMTAINGRSYLAGMEHAELTKIVQSTMRAKNKEFATRFNRFMERQAIIPANDNAANAPTKPKKARHLNKNKLST